MSALSRRRRYLLDVLAAAWERDLKAAMHRVDVLEAHRKVLELDEDPELLALFERRYLGEAA